MPQTKRTAAAERHMCALLLARDCVQLDARTRTIQLLTGLTASQITDLFHGHPGPSQRGRPPDSREWYYTTKLINRVQACMVASTYRRLRQVGVDPARSLVQGYAHYAEACKGRPCLSLDRAFDLVARLDGRWISSQRSFSLASCPTCHSQFLTGLRSGAGTAAECPFCLLIERFPRENRIQKSFPFVVVHEVPEILLPFDLVLRGLR